MRVRRPVPAPAAVVFILMLASAALLRGWQAVNTDGDLGRHLRVGETILRTGLFYEDRFSWTMAGRPFVPYEWLSEVLYALAHRAAGIPGALALTALVVAGSYLMLSLLLSRHNVDPLLAFLTVITAGLVGAFHWLARPHVFTFVGTVAILGLLEAPARARDRRSLLLAFVLFATWANLHGGFLFGLVLIAMYLVGDAVGSREWLPKDSALLLAALMGTLLNPVGIALLGHVAGYLGQAFLVDTTLEYRSPDFHGWIGRVFLAALLMVSGGLSLSRRPMQPRRLVVVLGTTAFALHSVRNIPLWGLTALPLAAMHLESEWRAIAAIGIARIRAAFEAAARMGSIKWWAASAAAALVTLAFGGGRLGTLQLLPNRFDPRMFPVDVVNQAREAGLSGRLFNELAWGGYILHAWAEQKVFIDGQTDFYGEALTRTYGDIAALRPGWRQALAQNHIALVILPTRSSLAHQLVREGWLEQYKDSTAVLLARPGDMIDRE